MASTAISKRARENTRVSVFASEGGHSFLTTSNDIRSNGYDSGSNLNLNLKKRRFQLMATNVAGDNLHSVTAKYDVDPIEQVGK